MKPEEAYRYALDNGPSDETREAVIKGYPDLVCNYAQYVDEKPRDDTRAAACKGASSACNYAIHVDNKPHDDTRMAACQDEYVAYWYALNVDGAPRDDTWKASGEHQIRYLQHVPGAIKLYLKDWLTRNRNNCKLMKNICGWDDLFTHTPAGWQSVFTKHHKIIKKLDIDAAVVYVLSIRRGG